MIIPNTKASRNQKKLQEKESRGYNSLRRPKIAGERETGFDTGQMGTALPLSYDT